MGRERDGQACNEHLTRRIAFEELSRFGNAALGEAFHERVELLALAFAVERFAMPTDGAEPLPDLEHEADDVFIDGLVQRDEIDGLLQRLDLMTRQ